jgi:hypothetical protein
MGRFALYICTTQSIRWFIIGVKNVGLQVVTVRFTEDEEMCPYKNGPNSVIQKLLPIGNIS